MATKDRAPALCPQHYVQPGGMLRLFSHDKDVLLFFARCQMHPVRHLSAYPEGRFPFRPLAINLSGLQMPSMAILLKITQVPVVVRAQCLL